MTTLVVVSIPLIILAIRWIVLGSLAGVPPGEQSIEANWAATIEKLGIEPRFPPEEDFVVGDLLALVVNDDDRNPYALNKIENAKTAIFTRRAVKLAYVDVKAALNDEYARLPLFSNAIESTPLPPPTSVPATPKSPKTTTLRRDFFTGVPLRDLPLAAFPRLKIQGTTSASAGISGAGFWGNFGAFNQNTEELELGEVRTYGLSSVRAHQLLDAYCEQQATKDNCTEDTARKHLKSLIGERSQAKYIINAEGEEAYAVTVEVVMVYRIYLTRSIKNRWQATWGQQGRGHQEPTIAETQAAKGSSSQSAGGDGDGNLLKRRMDDLERQLAEMRPTNAAAAASAYNRESYFQDTLDRPVAIGFRGIRVDLGRTGGKSKTKSLQ